MLQAVLEHIHNYFGKSRFSGTYTVSGGSIAGLDFLKEGQRFLVTGSDLNDGVYTYHADGIKNDDDIAGAGLSDETFTGAIVGLAVPPQVIALAAEITEWVGKNGDAINSPYTSESFGGYSYTLATGTGADGTSTGAGWHTVFGNRLNRWRKVAF